MYRLHPILSDQTFAMHLKERRENVYHKYPQYFKNKVTSHVPTAAIFHVFESPSGQKSVSSVWSWNQDCPLVHF